ncbi:MAG: tetratricopeptide repeat protein [Planctomycetota bacterium]|nr:tetratricopeptide repeat protein [Planctomycetota bacterium]
MSISEGPAGTESHAPESGGPRIGYIQVSVFLISAALLILQVSFTRLLGYKLFYHFVFLAISLSLLGLGAAGTYAAIRPMPKDLSRSCLRWLALLTLSIPITFLVMANPLPIVSHTAGRLKLFGTDAFQYLALCSPFMIWLNFCGGVVLARFFAAHSARMGKLYASDLLGASLGCLLCLALMMYGSPPFAFCMAALLTAAAAFPFYASMARGSPGRGSGLTLCAAGLLLAALVFLGPEWLRNFQNFRNAGRNLDVVRYEWNHMIRTDRDAGTYILDGDASTPIAVWKDQYAGVMNADPAYLLAPKEPEVAIIGFGGGSQVLQARMARAKRIYAIDINPTLARWVTHEDAEVNQRLFLSPEIEVVVDEGRHAVRSSGRTFDVLVMHAIDTYAATASGAYALSENFLYTKQALQDYYQALSPEGKISISRWIFNPPRENLRLFVTGLEALKELGVAEPEKHFAIIVPVPDYNRMGEQRVWGLLMISRNPLGPEQVKALQEHVARNNWTLLYAPGVESGTPFDRYARSADRAAFRAAYPFVITPVTDASPYLFLYYNPLHASSYRATNDRLVWEIYQSSSVLLFAAVAVSAVLSLLLIVLPLFFQKDARAAGLSIEQCVYFAGLGVGFMALEIPLVQALTLYLGHPTFGFSVALVALLLATGAGSFCVDRFAPSRAAIGLLVAALLAVLAFGLFPFVEHTIHWPAPARFAAGIVLAMACGFPMGFPLAMGVKELGREHARNIPWAWAVNGAASVIGSTVVMLVMVFSGSREALIFGAVCYLLSAWAGKAWRSAGVPVWKRPLPWALAGGAALLCAGLLATLSVKGGGAEPSYEDEFASAQIAREQGRFVDAERAFKAAVKSADEDGRGEAAVLAALDGLTGLYFQNGKFQDAEPYAQRAHDLRVARLGPEHLETVRSIEDMAIVRFSQGRTLESVEMLKTALAVREKAQGPGHPAAKSTRQWLEKAERQQR